MKNNKGITLVALVITIIILIILAGISISILLGEGGLINKAQQGAVNYQKAEETERSTIDAINEKIDSITTEGTTTTPTPTTNIAYTLGQEVTVNGEQFFVIEENDSESKDTITLITKYNLDPSSNAQLNAAAGYTAVEFCSDPDNTGNGYWYEEGEEASKYPYDLNGIESSRATAYNKAVAYADAVKTATGTTGTVTGRLLTSSEAGTLKENGKIPDIIAGKDYTTGTETTDNNLQYWLGTAYSYNYVNYMDGKVSYPNNFTVFYHYGVRPVITVSKSLVSL